MSDRLDLHAIDDGSGLLIPIFAMLVSRQDGRRYCRERTEGGIGVKGRRREREKYGSQRNTAAMYVQDCVNGRQW